MGPVFIVGCDRSGTTLLRLMLDQSPELHIPEESRFLTALDRSRPDYGDFSGARQRWFFIRDLQANRSTDSSLTFPIFGLSPEEAEEALRAASPASFAGAAAALFSASARKKSKPRWGDKTPCQVLDIARLAAEFPGAQFVHVVRDGRDVAASLLKLGWAADARSAARLWKSRVEAGRAAGRPLGEGRYREVRYEELVSRPEAALRELCAWLGLAYAPAMLRYHETAASRIVPEHAEFHPLVCLPPDASRASAWTRTLSRRQVADFEALAGETLRAFGYPVAGRGISPWLTGARGVAKTAAPTYRKAEALLRRLGVLAW